MFAFGGPPPRAAPHHQRTGTINTLYEEVGLARTKAVKVEADIEAKMCRQREVQEFAGAARPHPVSEDRRRPRDGHNAWVHACWNSGYRTGKARAATASSRAAAGRRWRPATDGRSYLDASRTAHTTTIAARQRRAQPAPRAL